MTIANKHLRVLYSVPPPSSASNPYTTMLAQHVSREASVQFFSWKKALLGRHDVFHIHWPEAIVRHRRPVKRVARTLAGFIYLMRARITRSAIVMTIHNRLPHERGGWLEDRFLSALDARVSTRIYLTDDGNPRVEPSVVIPHGDYREWPPYMGPKDREASGILFFGAIRKYKGLESAISAFRSDLSMSSTFDIAGAVSDTAYEEELRTLIGGDTRIRFAPGRLSDAELASRVRGAALAVLPYRDFYNSGAVLLALSLATHVLLPRNEVTTQLQDEFGTEWVSLFEPPLAPVDIRGAADAAARASGTPDMTQRSWSKIQTDHLVVYRSATSSRSAKKGSRTR